jgi:hypothetical protein
MEGIFPRDIFWLLLRKYLPAGDSFRLASTCKTYYEQIKQFKSLLIAGFSISVVERDREEFEKKCKQIIETREAKRGGRTPIYEKKLCVRCYRWIKEYKFDEHVRKAKCPLSDYAYCSLCRTRLHPYAYCPVEMIECKKCDARIPRHVSARKKKCYICGRFAVGFMIGCSTCKFECKKQKCASCGELRCFKTIETRQHTCKRVEQYYSKSVRVGNVLKFPLSIQCAGQEEPLLVFVQWLIVKDEKDVPEELNGYDAVVLESQQRRHPILKKK